MFLWFLFPHPSGEDCWILCQLSPPSFLLPFRAVSPQPRADVSIVLCRTCTAKTADHLRSSVPCRTSTAIIRGQCSLATPQPRPSCGQCSLPGLNCDLLCQCSLRTSTATICAQCSLPGLHREIECQKRMSEDMSERMSEDMSERMSERRQKICQTECPKVASSESVKLTVTGRISGDELYVYPHLTRSG